MTDVKSRGWNDAMIRRFLGDPDEIKANPRFKSASPMKLYRTGRIKQAETLAEFKEMQTKYRGRGVTAQKGVASKKRKLAEYVESVVIEVPQLGEQELIQRACTNYNSLPQRMHDDNYASASSDPKFLARIRVNYLRHRLTQYEAHLDKIAGKVGRYDAYVSLKKKVLRAIASKYEDLREECSLQELDLQSPDTRPD